jgi:hypothetical protein
LTSGGPRDAIDNDFTTQDSDGLPDQNRYSSIENQPEQFALFQSGAMDTLTA